MKYDKNKYEPMMSILFLISAVVIAFADKFITGINYLISQIIAYLLIIFILYAGEVFSKKIRVLFIISTSLMLIAEIGLYINK